MLFAGGPEIICGDQGIYGALMNTCSVSDYRKALGKLTFDSYMALSKIINEHCVDITIREHTMMAKRCYFDVYAPVSIVGFVNKKIIYMKLYNGVCASDDLYFEPNKLKYAGSTCRVFKYSTKLTDSCTVEVDITLGDFCHITDIEIKKIYTKTMLSDEIYKVDKIQVRYL